RKAKQKSLAILFSISALFFCSFFIFLLSNYKTFNFIIDPVKQIRDFLPLATKLRNAPFCHPRANGDPD
ncbi:MAG: hypothetical protein ABII94_01175, partial [Patescibacteria group bacterium]